MASPPLNDLILAVANGSLTPAQAVAAAQGTRLEYAVSYAECPAASSFGLQVTFLNGQVDGGPDADAYRALLAAWREVRRAVPPVAAPDLGFFACNGTR